MLEEPLKQAIYGKGSISSAATEALRHLSCKQYLHMPLNNTKRNSFSTDIAPDLIFPDLLKRIYNALESLTAVRLA